MLAAAVADAKHTQQLAIAGSMLPVSVSQAGTDQVVQFKATLWQQLMTDTVSSQQSAVSRLLCVASDKDSAASSLQAAARTPARWQNN